jgi:hypothetical protein
MLVCIRAVSRASPDSRFLLLAGKFRRQFLTTDFFQERQAVPHQAP